MAGFNPPPAAPHPRLTSAPLRAPDTHRPALLGWAGLGSAAPAGSHRTHPAATCAAAPAPAVCALRLGPPPQPAPSHRPAAGSGSTWPGRPARPRREGRRQRQRRTGPQRGPRGSGKRGRPRARVRPSWGRRARVGAAPRTCPSSPRYGCRLVIEGKTPPRAKPTPFDVKGKAARVRGGRFAPPPPRRAAVRVRGVSRRPGRERGSARQCRGIGLSPHDTTAAGQRSARDPAGPDAGRSEMPRAGVAFPQAREVCGGRHRPAAGAPVGHLGSKPREEVNPHLPPRPGGWGWLLSVQPGCACPAWPPRAGTRLEAAGAPPPAPGPGRTAVRMTPRPNGASALSGRSISI